jgi:hypothetical protein
MFQALAQPMLARLKPPKQAVNSHRVEHIRDSHPDNGNMMTSAIRAEVNTQLI